MQTSEIINNLSVAKFWYKGTHTRHIRRTIILIESCNTYLRGYEIREGNIIRSLKDAPIKSYTKSKIATEEQLRKTKNRQKTKNSTLNQLKLVDLIEKGL